MTTYYISPTGDDNDDATNYNTPWALSALESTTKYTAGDDLVLKNGIYTFPEGKSMELPMVYLYESGTVGAPITIQAETVGEVILDGDFRAYSGFFIVGDALQYLTITGFEIKNTRWAGIHENNLPNNLQPSHHITLYRNHIHHVAMRLEYNPPQWEGIVGIGTGPGTHHWVADSNIIHDIGRTNPLFRICRLWNT